MFRPAVRLGSVPLHALTRKQAVEAISARLRSGRPGYVVLSTVDHVVHADADPALREAYQDAFLSLAAASPLVWASKLKDGPLPERVSGLDLVAPLLLRASRNGWSVYFLSGEPGVARAAARRVQQLLPGLRIVGTDSAAVGPQADDRGAWRAFDNVCRARPQLLLLGLEGVRQERWMHAFSPALPGTVVLGVGSTLERLAGAEAPPPAWMSRAGLAGVYRAVQDPQRWFADSLLGNPGFAWKMAVSRRGQHGAA